MDSPLADLLVRYLAGHDCGLRYRESLRRTVKKAGEAGIDSVAHLTAPLVNRFLSDLSTLSATTRSNIRRELLTLWRYAFEEELTDVPPMRVLRIRPRSTPPQAWSLEEMQQLVALAERDETSIGMRINMRICDWLPCWIVVAYDTGLRFGDILALKKSNVRNGVISTVASKTGKLAVRRLSDYATTQLDALLRRSPDGTVFSWFLTRRRAFLCMRAFLNRHDMHGSMKYLRRACATYIESSRPGEATRYLQHSAPTVTSRHYLDESLLAVPAGPPPIK